MPQLQNNAESASSGTTVDTTNSLGTNANAFDTVTIGANMTLTYDNAHPAHGANAFKVALTSTATAATYVVWKASWTAVNELWGAVYYWCDHIPTAGIRLVQFRNSNADCSWISVVSGTAQVQIRNWNDLAQGTPSTALAISTLYRIEFHIIFNSNTGETGRATVYPADSTVPLAADAVVTNTFLGQGGASSTSDEVRFGATLPNFSTTPGDAFYFDSINVNTTGFPGPGPYPSSSGSLPHITTPMLGVSG